MHNKYVENAEKSSDWIARLGLFKTIVREIGHAWRSAILWLRLIGEER